MNADDTSPLGGFERRLLGDLRGFIEARSLMDPRSAPRRGRLVRLCPRPRFRPRIVGAGAALAAVAIVAVVLALTATTATPPAYAVTRHSNGMVTVTIRRLSGPGITSLNARFRRMGIHMVAVPVRAGCPTQDTAIEHPFHPHPAGILIVLPDANAPHASLTFSPAMSRYFWPHGTGIVAVEQVPGGRLSLRLGGVEGSKAPTCLRPWTFPHLPR